MPAGKASHAQDVVTRLAFKGLSGNKLSVSTTTAQSAAINGQYVDVVASEPMFIAVGTNPTAVEDTSYRIPKEVIVRIPWTDGDKLAAIVASGTASLWYYPVNRVS